MLYYAWNETREKEYWGVGDSPKEIIQKLVDLYNANYYYCYDTYTVERFIEEYPDGYVATIELNEAFDTDCNKPSEKSKEVKTWEEIWYE